MKAAARADPLVRAMPVVFVLIWSTGFIVARYGMPHAPPMKFLALRYVLSVAAFLVWALLARAAWPRNGRQLAHLAVTGIFMHAGYLGGVWAAVKAGMGAGLAALLVGLQPVLTAVWISTRGGQVAPRQWAGFALGLAGLVLVVWQKLGLGEVVPLNLAFALVALLAITAGTLYQKRFVTPCDVRTANLVQLAAALVVTLPLALLETEAMRWWLADGALNGELAGAVVWSVLGLTLGGSVTSSAAASCTKLAVRTSTGTTKRFWYSVPTVIENNAPIASSNEPVPSAPPCMRCHSTSVSPPRPNHKPTHWRADTRCAALREWMAQIGASRSVAVHMIGKVKTVTQMVAIPFLLYDGKLFRLIDTRIWGTVLIYIAAVLTIWSMVYYLQKAIPEIRAKSR